MKKSMYLILFQGRNPDSKVYIQNPESIPAYSKWTIPPPSAPFNCLLDYNLFVCLSKNAHGRRSKKNIDLYARGTGVKKEINLLRLPRIFGNRIPKIWYHVLAGTNNIGITPVVNWINRPIPGVQP